MSEPASTLSAAPEPRPCSTVRRGWWPGTARTTPTRSIISCTSASAGRWWRWRSCCLPFRPLWSLGLFLAGLRDHVLRPLRLRAEHPHDLQAPEHAVRHRLVGHPAALRRVGPAGDAASGTIKWMEDFTTRHGDRHGHRRPPPNNAPHRPGRPRPPHDAGRVHQGRLPGRLALRAGPRSRRSDGSTTSSARADRPTDRIGCSCTMTNCTPASSIIRRAAASAGWTAGHGLRSPPRPGHLSRSGTARAPRRGRDGSPTSSSRSSAQAAGNATSSTSARSTCGWASANTGSSTPRSGRCTPWSVRATPGRRRSCPQRGIYRTNILPGLEVRPGELLGPASGLMNLRT